MNIVILANRDLASNYALNLLLPTISEQHQVRVFLSAQVGSRSSPVNDELIGLKYFEQKLATELIFPKLDTTELGTGQLKSFKALGPHLSHEIELVTELDSHIPKLSLADLIISIRFGRILRQNIIDLPKFGVLNLHSGALPQYRGVMASFWAMLNEETELGTSLHYIDSAAIDEGPVISINKQATNYERCYLSNVLSLYPAGCAAITEAVKKISNGEALKQQAQSGTAAYYSFPKKNDIEDFLNKDLELVNEAHLLEFYQQYFSDATSLAAILAGPQKLS